MENGEAEFLIPASSAGRFAVNVSGKNILFKQPGRFRILSTDDTPLEIAVWKGEAGVRDLASGKEVSVKAHETFALNPEDLGQYHLANSVLGDDLDRWSEQRDEDLKANYAAGNTYTNPVYNQSYQTGGYGSGYVAAYPYPYDLYGYSAFGCPYGFGQPFWFGSPGSCWNSGFFFSPFFFAPPVVVVVRPPILPRRPIPLRPPTPPEVAKGGTGNTVAKPVFQSFREPGGGQPVLNGDNFQHTGIRPGESSPHPGQNGLIMNDTARTPSTAPVQHPAGSMPPPTHAAPLPPPQHSMPPMPPPARPHSFSGPRGPSGGFSHASAPHSSGRR
jgi:hypothetical protein